MQGERRGSRLGGPLKSSTNPATAGDSDAESALDVAKQMEMEAGNAIKYRTCSWQKVRDYRRCSLPYVAVRWCFLECCFILRVPFLRSHEQSIPEAPAAQSVSYCGISSETHCFSRVF